MAGIIAHPNGKESNAESQGRRGAKRLIIVECKATSKYNEVFEAQTLTYLRLTGLKLGLVVNFGEKLVKDGFHRVVNGL